MTLRDATRRLAMPALLGLAVAGCEEIEQVQDRFRDLTPREAYLASLEEAGLTEAALGRDWIAAGRAALDDAVAVPLPFHEVGYLDPAEASAAAFRLEIGRGQRLTAEVRLEGADAARVFVDLFRVPEDSRDPLRPVLSTDSVPGTFHHEPWRGGSFVLRLQPELLRGGRYSVTLRLEAQLAFPVEGHGPRAIQSFFGADRDGGRRSHHGVDIFAPRGTPVLATSDGSVRRVEVTSRGGKVVWLRDEARNASIYYAHLDSQYVRGGQRVSRGDTLGFVGNSGNARSTPPHLHFGIYRRGEGPVDPAPFIRPPSGTLASLTAETRALGEWLRLTRSAAPLRTAPDTRAGVVRTLELHTPLQVRGASGSFYRVRLPDGSSGYVSARLTEGAERAIATRVAAAGSRVRAAPSRDAVVTSELPSDTPVGVLGRFGPYLYVRAEGGTVGWLESPID